MKTLRSSLCFTLRLSLTGLASGCATSRSDDDHSTAISYQHNELIRTGKPSTNDDDDTAWLAAGKCLWWIASPMVYDFFASNPTYSTGK